LRNHASPESLEQLARGVTWLGVLLSLMGLYARLS